MDKNIEDHRNQCMPSQTTMRKGVPPEVPITMLPITSGPSQRIQADLFGPLKDSLQGNRYILVIIDAFTKMVRLTAIQGKEAITMTKALLDDIYRFRIRRTVVPDAELFDSLRIDRKITTRYHPGCNGTAENFNKIMINNIAAQIKEQGKLTLDWEEFLAPLIFNYNTLINKATIVTPFQAPFGYNPRVPLWSGIIHRFEKHLKDATGTANSTPEKLANIKNNFQTARGVVLHNLQHRRRSQEEANGKAHPNAKWPTYKPNDCVWVYIDARKEGGKLQVWSLMGESKHHWDQEALTIPHQERSWQEEEEDQQHAENQAKALRRQTKTHKNQAQTLGADEPSTTTETRSRTATTTAWKKTRTKKT
jgi:hypothetical protein